MCCSPRFRPALGMFALVALGFAVLTGGCPGSGGSLPLPGVGGDAGGTGGGQGEQAIGVTNLPPTVVLDADVTRGLVPLTVRFDSGNSTDDGLIVRREWEFGDGGTSLQIAPSHTYTAIGEYTVTLTLTDDDGATASRTTTITVTQAPLAVIDVDRTVAETSPATFQFDASGSTDADGTIASYRWDFADGTIETRPVVTHTFARPGNYRVELTVTDDAGARGVATVVIQVGIPQPQVVIRTPPSSLSRLIVPQDAPLWARIEFLVEPSVAFFTVAGLDGDADPCDPVALVYGTAETTANVEVIGHNDRIRDVRFSPDGTEFITASNDESLRLYDSVTGDLLIEYTADNDPNVTVQVAAAAFSPDGSQIVYGLSTGELVMINKATGAVIWRVAAHGDEILGVDYAPTGDVVATASADGTARVWSAAAGGLQRTFAGHNAAVQSVAFSPVNGQLVVSTSNDGTARIWNWLSGAALQTFLGHGAIVFDAAFSPDGGRLASVGADNNARIWSVDTGAELLLLSGHTSDATAVAFGADDTTEYIVTGSSDATARTWNANTGEQLSLVQPCVTRISAVDIDASGTATLVGVWAKASIPLDVPTGQGGDVSLETPQPLVISNVPTGTYFLWAELDTDRTAPTRVYSQTDIQVIAPLTSTISAEVPRITLTDDEAAVVVAPSTRRQIFNIGALNAGDRVILSYLSVPGFQPYFRETIIGRPPTENQGTEIDGFSSVMLLDATQELITWYQDRFTLFTPDSLIVAAEDGLDHYFVTDTATSVNVRVERGFGLQAQSQRIYLNFQGGNSIRVGGQPPATIPPFDATQLNPGYTPADNALIKQLITQNIRRLLEDYDVTVVSSDEGGPPAPPYQTLYFDAGTGIENDPDQIRFYTVDPDVPFTCQPAEDNLLFGVADFVDPRNDTAVGAAIVGVQTVERLLNPRIDQDCTPPAAVPANTMGVALANATAHQLGFLLGLRETEGTLNDLMDRELLKDTNTLTTTTPEYSVGDLRDDEQYNSPGIGIQNAPELFEALIGAP